MSRDLVFVYDHFYPDYSAGGPVTSLANLAGLISSYANVKIVTSAYYYHSGKKFEGIQFNRWVDYNGVSVWYAESPGDIDSAMKSLSPGTTVYLNGIFSKNYFLRILRLSRQHQLDVVVSPRGMLQRGALQNKYLKKYLYLSFLKITSKLKNVRWHATDHEEQSDIRKHFGKTSDVTVIPNVPRLPVESNTYLEKSPGELKLVCFSLISRKKNVGFLIDILNTSDLAGVSLDIVGPVKDPDYWSECQAVIQRSNGSVNYLGDIEPVRVNEILSRYHLFVLPTHGENFGHAVVEAMSSYRPVLISEHTPWKDVTAFRGGFSLPLDPSQWVEALKEARNWSQADFDKACVGAMDYFRSKISMSALRSMYLSLFRVQS